MIRVESVAFKYLLTSLVTSSGSAYKLQERKITTCNLLTLHLIALVKFTSEMVLLLESQQADVTFTSETTTSVECAFIKKILRVLQLHKFLQRNH